MDSNLIVIPALLVVLLSGLGFVMIMFMSAWKSTMRYQRLAVSQDVKLHRLGAGARKYGDVDCFHECMTVSRWDDNENSACASMCGIRKE